MKNSKELKCEIKELKKLIEKPEDFSGGSSYICAGIGGAVAVTVSLCPTTKCTSRCR